MRLYYTPLFLEDSKKLPAELAAHLKRQLNLLKSNPHHPSLHTHKRKGANDLWQARVNRNYRIFFRIKGEVIELLTVRPHE